MADQPFDTTDRGLQGVLGVIGPGHGSAEPGVRYRLVVVAADVADVVRFAGGWLFDRSMAGWDVTVLVADHPDERPLQILGARILDLEYALATVGHRPPPQTLAAAADLFDCDSRVRQGVLQALDQGATEVTLWGQTWPVELDSHVGLVEHRLSAAAQAFKAQALAAAGLDARSIAAIETFRSRVMSGPRVQAVLVPAN
jgi:hypothetical protein